MKDKNNRFNKLNPIDKTPAISSERFRNIRRTLAQLREVISGLNQLRNGSNPEVINREVIRDRLRSNGTAVPGIGTTETTTLSSMSHTTTPKNKKP